MAHATSNSVRERGTVARVLPEGYGWIRRPSDEGGAGSLFFHVSELDKSLEFDERLTELRVEYTIVAGERGLRAVRITAAD